MTDFVKSKVIRGLTIYEETILTAFTVALIMVILAGCEEAYTSSSQPSVQLRGPIKVSAYSSAEISVLSEQIKQLVKSLEYSDKVADHFAQMVIDWEDAQGRPVLITWKEKLANAKQECKKGKISKNHVVKIEESVIRELCHRIKKQFSYEEDTFVLDDVIQNQHANCLGYSQLIYIAGNAVGLSVRVIDVTNVSEYVTLEKDVQEKGHVACIIDLSDGQLVMADMAISFVSISKAFELESQFVKVGNYWEIRNKDNPLRIHRRIQISDRNGLIAMIYNSRGAAYGAKGEHDRAILDYNKAIEINPRDAQPYNNRGNAYQNKGEYDRAILDYNKAIEINQKFALAYCNRGIAYEAKGEHERAILDCTKAIEINPKLAEAYVNRGSAYEAKGEHERAILDCTKAIEINPRYAKAYNNRGIAYEAKGEHDRAISDYTKAIEIDPRCAAAYYNRGSAYVAKGEHDRAISDCTKAIEIDPRDADAYYSRGISYHLKAQYDLAISDYTKAIEINPRYADAYYNRGSAYKVKGEHDRAISDYTKAIDIDPRDANTYYNRGIAYEDKGDIDRAILDYTKAIMINTKYSFAYYRRGTIYAILGKSEEAKKDLLKAVKLNPSLKSQLKQISDQLKLGL